MLLVTVTMLTFGEDLFMLVYEYASHDLIINRR